MKLQNLFPLSKLKLSTNKIKNKFFYSFIKEKKNKKKITIKNKSYFTLLFTYFYF